MIYVFLLLAEGVNSLCLNSTPMPNTTEQCMNLKNKEFGKCSAKTVHDKYQITTSKNRDYLKCHSVKRVQQECKLFEV